MTNILENIFGKKKAKKTSEERMKEIKGIVDQLAYKWSIPQTTVGDIITTWQTYEHKVFGIEFK